MKIRIVAAALLLVAGGLSPTLAISPEVVESAIAELVEKNPSDARGIETGVRQIARLWQDVDGDDASFRTFCLEEYIADPDEKREVFLKVSDYLEAIYGNFSRMSERLGWHVTVDTGPILPVDRKFSSLSPGAHLTGDMYDTKIAFYIALNFPKLTLREKEALGGDRQAWAYARLGDWFTTRIPTEVQQHGNMVSIASDRYIDAYNIHMGHLLNPGGKKVFPEDMILLNHWNLRDEIKANYNKGEEGLDKQQTIYEVMKRIIGQDIPAAVINSGDYDWNPYDNTLRKDGEPIAHTPESPGRYQMLLDNFHARQMVDKYTGDTYLDRKFNDDMEMALADVEALFDGFLSAPELVEVGRMISGRMGRDLRAFDIWYDGFKPRSGLDIEKLDRDIALRYPDAAAMESDLAAILIKLGYSAPRAGYIADKIAVDQARGSGHAAGAVMKGQKSRLRTRVVPGGMDYKGYNIAIHELGHNVEQTVSLYDVDYFMLNGVPNTSFTEALAFVFQKRDLEILGIADDDPEREKMELLDKVWSLYEIAGVSMLDIAAWKWMYANPDATAIELQQAVVRLSKELWNKYYLPVFGVKDETVLAVYSHMIGSPLYLSAYAFGQIIEYQLENHFAGRDFASEVDRIYTLGRLTPNVWIEAATGNPLSVEPILKDLRAVINR